MVLKRLLWWVLLAPCFSQHNVLKEQVKVNSDRYRVNKSPSSVVLPGEDFLQIGLQYDYPLPSDLAKDPIVFIVWEAFDDDAGPSCVYYKKWLLNGSAVVSEEQLLNKDCDATTVERSPVSMYLNETAMIVGFSHFKLAEGNQSLGIFARIVNYSCPDCTPQPLLRLDQGVPGGKALVLTSLFPTNFGIVSVWTECDLEPEGGLPTHVVGSFRCLSLRSRGTLWARSFGHNGSPLGDAFQVNPGLADQRWGSGASDFVPGISAENEHVIFISWVVLLHEEARVNILGQRFTYSMDGTIEPAAEAFHLNEDMLLTFPFPVTAAIPKVGFVVSWSNDGTIHKNLIEVPGPTKTLQHDQFQTFPIIAAIWPYYPGYATLYFGDRNLYIRFFEDEHQDTAIGEELQVNSIPLNETFSETTTRLGCYFEEPRGTQPQLGDFCFDEVLDDAKMLDVYTMMIFACQVVTWASGQEHTTLGEDIYVQFVFPPPLPSPIKEGLECNTSAIYFAEDESFNICTGTGFANCTMLQHFDDTFVFETSVIFQDTQDSTLFRQSEGSCLVDLSLRDRSFCGTFSSCDSSEATALCSQPVETGERYNFSFQWTGTLLSLDVRSNTTDYSISEPFSEAIAFRDAQSFLCYDGNSDEYEKVKFYGTFYYFRTRTSKTRVQIPPVPAPSLEPQPPTVPAPAIPVPATPVPTGPVPTGPVQAGPVPTVPASPPIPGQPILGPSTDAPTVHTLPPSNVHTDAPTDSPINVPTEAPTYELSETPTKYPRVLVPAPLLEPQPATPTYPVPVTPVPTGFVPTVPTGRAPTGPVPTVPASPSIPGPSIPGPSIPGPSIPGPPIPGPSIPGPSTDAPSLIVPAPTDDEVIQTPGTETGGLSDGAIAGIVIGVFFGILLLAVLVWFFCFRKKEDFRGEAIVPQTG